MTEFKKEGDPSLRRTLSPTEIRERSELEYKKFRDVLDFKGGQITSEEDVASDLVELLGIPRNGVLNAIQRAQLRDGAMVKTGPPTDKITDPVHEVSMPESEAA